MELTASSEASSDRTVFIISWAHQPCVPSIWKSATGRIFTFGFLWLWRSPVLFFTLNRISRLF